MVRVLFVCTGNICRSPAAEGVFRSLVAARGLHDRIEIDSAGIGGWHVGEPPDPRTQQTAAARGIDLSGQRARQVRPDDFALFDFLVAMDRGHAQSLSEQCPPGETHRISLFLERVPDAGTLDVPDPYYGGGDGFERVMDMIEKGAVALLDEIADKHFAD